MNLNHPLAAVLLAATCLGACLVGASPALAADPAPAQPPAADKTLQPLPALTPPEGKQWKAAPPMMLEADKTYLARITLKKGGAFVILLDAKAAPQTVNSFVFLARNGFFDGVTFHRVLEGFMAQGGDPTGTGMGGPGYQFAYEANQNRFNAAGVVAMANGGARTPTNGSQFFITFGPCPQLDGGYTIFGRVVQGMEAVNGLRRRDPNDRPDFLGDAMSKVEIFAK